MDAVESGPLVCIGIPTYDRAQSVGRAIESALAQDYRNLEVVISDDASRDNTEAVCRGYAARDARVRFVRQVENIGLTRNFLEVLRLSRSDYFVWLGDDDWFEPAYVRSCMDMLMAFPDVAAVSGLAHQYRNGAFTAAGVVMNLPHSSKYLRVVRYFMDVGDNCTLYGVMRKHLMLNCRMPNTLGGDWIFVSEMAFQGRIFTVEGALHHRERVGATSETIPRIVRRLGLPAWQRVFPFVAIALAALRHVGWESPVYGSVGAARRCLLAFAVFGAIVFAKAPVNYFKRSVIAVIGINRARRLKAFLLRTHV